MLPSDFFRRNVVLSFQEDAIGIRLPPPFPPPLAGEGQGGGVENMMWGSDYPHRESTFPQSRKILAEILAGVPDDEQAKPARTTIRGSPAPTPPACTILTRRGWPSLLEEPISLRIDELGVPLLFTEAERFRSWLDVEAALAELTIIPAEMPDSGIHGMRIGLCFRR
jgi:hypothetical protein